MWSVRGEAARASTRPSLSERFSGCRSILTEPVRGKVTCATDSGNRIVGRVGILSQVDIEQWWRLIDQARDAAGATEPERIAERASVLLSERPPDQIVAAQQALWDLMAISYRADLWAAAYLINGGASDDGFEYFRGWLITQGADTFTRAVGDPDSLATCPAVITAAENGAELECESMLGVAWHAYRTATGQNLPDGSFTIRYPALEPGCDPEDPRWARQRLPRLSELFL